MIKLAAPLVLAVLLVLPACDHTHGVLPDASRPGGDGLALHTAPPWRPPVIHADGSAGPGCDGGTVSPPPGPATWTLLGDVVQVTPCAGGGDAAQVHVALSAQCGDWSALLQTQTVSLAATRPRYVFSVPDGTYHLIAFADCGGGAGSSVAPKPGDVQLVTTSPALKPCRTYKLKGQGLLELPIKLGALVK